jgi:hypothetical protein
VRIGATALIVAMIDDGMSPENGVSLKSPLDALRTFASDTDCQETTLAKDGRRLSAIAIQRHYLDQARSFASRDTAPEWAPEVCARWGDVLDRLEDDPTLLQPSLDWAIKFPIYQTHARNRGFAWSDLPHWNHIMTVIQLALRDAGFKGQRTVELVLGKDRENSPIKETIDGLSPYLAEHGLDWETLRPFVDLRKELFELDLRFGQLSNDGIFNTLDEAGVLDHALPDLGDVDGARTTPPTNGRARRRGDCVRAHAGTEGFRTSWESVWDINGKRLLDLSDPLKSDGEWRPLPDRRLKARVGPREREMAEMRRLMGLEPEFLVGDDE